MKRFFLILMCAAAWMPAFSQQNPDEESVKNLLERFFTGMKDKDSDTLQKAFHIDAVIQTVITEDGVVSLGTSDISDFLKRVATSEVELEERLLSYAVQVDGAMAHAWTPYEFYVDGKFSHCGVNSFQLIRVAEGWQIVHVMDTRRREGCR